MNILKIFNEKSIVNCVLKRVYYVLDLEVVLDVLLDVLDVLLDTLFGFFCMRRICTCSWAAVEYWFDGTYTHVNQVIRCLYNIICIERDLFITSSEER